MSRLGDLRLGRGRQRRERPGPSRRRPRRADVPAPRPAHDRPARGRDAAEIEATWFGRRFIERRLQAGDEVVVSGKVKRFGRKLTLDNPEFQHDDRRGRPAPRRADRARLPADRRPDRGAPAARDPRGPRPGRHGLSRSTCPPRSARARTSPPIGQALEEAHYPATLRGARRRAPAARVRRAPRPPARAWSAGGGSGAATRPVRSRSTTRPTPGSGAAIERLDRAASSGDAVELTADQDAADRRDPGRPRAGDARCSGSSRATSGRARRPWRRRRSRAAALGGVQGALLAPTDLLARQHARTLGALLEDLGDPGRAADRLAERPTARARRREAIRPGQARVVVGTHALHPGDGRVRRPRPGRHRRAAPFRRRAAGPARGEGRRAASPHVLLMTATPIPRTLGQVLYADLDVSRTSGRRRRAGVPIRTGIRRPGRPRGDLGSRSARRRPRGHRTFVVVPLVEEADEDEVAAIRARSRRESRGRAGCASSSRRSGSGWSTAG